MGTPENNETQEVVPSQGDKDEAITLKGMFPCIIWASRKANRV